MSKTLKIYIALLVLLIVSIAYIDANRPKPIDWNPYYQTHKKTPLGLYVFNEEFGTILGEDFEKVNETPYEYLSYYANFYDEDDYNYDDDIQYEYVSDDNYIVESTEDEETDSAETTETYEEAVETISEVETDEYEEDEIANESDNEDESEKLYGLEGTFLYINNDYEIDDQSTKSLLKFVSDGNTAFISTNGFSNILTDSLKIDTDYFYDQNDTLHFTFDQSTPFKSEYKMSKGFKGYYFKEIDSTKTQVLGFQKYSAKKHTNFIAIKYKKGTFYLHTQPAAFSNFHLLKANHAQYATELLSYIPENKSIYWIIKDRDFNSVSNSPMRYILAQPALKWAWYLFLIGMLFFFIFNAKRRQRIVPIYVSLTNTTVDFIKTIGNLYFQEGNHNTIIDKKIIYFLERVRNEFLIDTHNLDEDFIKKLHLKSGKKLQDIQLIIRLIKKSNKTYQNSEEDLIAINQAIENFWK